ncbi:MAG: hypothetical protein IKB70_00325 [Bacilli bacterium]|nr:hypothetical protein [Bacilli bacterium]
MVRKGDDTNAFGFKFLEVNFAEADQYTISKAEIRIGTIIKTVENPIFPIEISLDREETIKLNECRNQCYMAIYDSEDRKITLEGTLSFPAEPKVV